jgi:hypothetical protein
MNWITTRCKENGMLLIGVPRHFKGRSSKSSGRLITGAPTCVLTAPKELQSVLFNINVQCVTPTNLILPVQNIFQSMSYFELEIL